MVDAKGCEAKVKEWMAQRDELAKRIDMGQRQLQAMAVDLQRLEGAIAGAQMLLSPPVAPPAPAAEIQQSPSENGG